MGRTTAPAADAPPHTASRSHGKVNARARARTSVRRRSKRHQPLGATALRARKAFLVRWFRAHHFGSEPSFRCRLAAMNASISSTGHRFDRGPRLTGCGISPSRCQRYRVASEIWNRSITSSRRRSLFSITLTVIHQIPRLAHNRTKKSLHATTPEGLSCPLCSMTTLSNAPRAPLVEGDTRQQLRRERAAGRRKKPPDRFASAHGPSGTTLPRAGYSPARQRLSCILLRRGPAARRQGG